MGRLNRQGYVVSDADEGRGTCKRRRGESLGNEKWRLMPQRERETAREGRKPGQS